MSQVETEVGSGSIVQLAWMAGLSYLVPIRKLRPAIQEFPTALRGFLQGLATDAAPPPVSLADSTGEAVVGVETVLMSSDAGAVVTVVNWGGVSLSATLALTLNLTAAGFDSAGTELGEVTDASSGVTSQAIKKSTFALSFLRWIACDY